MIPLQMAFRDKHPVTRIAFSPDQGTIAVAQPHAGITLLERGTGRTVAVCPTPKRDALTGLAFTGDGRLLVAGSAKGLSVFDAATGAWVANSTHSPNNGLVLATTETGVLGVNRECRRREWVYAQFLDGDFNFRWPGGASPGKVLALDPTGRVALAEARDGAVLFDFAAGRVVGRADRAEPAAGAPAPALPGAAFCPLGRRFALNDGRSLDVYDTGPADDGDEDERPADTPLVQRARGTQRAVVAPAPRAVLSAVFALRPERPGAGDWRPPFALLPDGRGLLVKRPRNRVQLWDAPAGVLVNEWSWQLEWVTCLAVSVDGMTGVAGGRFGRVLLWDLD